MGVFLIGNAQVITIRDKESSRPVEMVSLSSVSPRGQVYTNSKGQADISMLKGADQISISLIGYRPEIKSYSELEKEGFVLYLVPSNISLDQVVISVNKWGQSSRDVPARVTTIGSKQIALQNPQTAADLLATSGEVFIQKSQQGGGSPMIRGFATNRVLITVDGIRMNTAIFRSGNLQNVISLDPFATERTEVVFGPASVIYGSDAIAGVMNFYTLTPQLSLNDTAFIKGSALGRFSSANNEQTGHFDVNVGWKKWALVTSFSHFDFDDLRMGSHGPEEYLRNIYTQRADSVDQVFTNEDPLVQRPTGYSQMNMMQKLRFRPNDKWDLNYGFHYSITSNYSRYDRLIRYRSNGLPRSAEWYYGPQEWMMNNLTVTHTPGKGFYDGMSIRLAQQIFEESRIDRDFNDPERRTRVEQVDAYSANIDLNKTIGTRHKLFYGLEAVYNDVTSTGTDEDITTSAIAPGPARYPQSEWYSYGAYATYQLRATEKLLLQAGARYNQFMLDARFDTTFYQFPFTTASINDDAVTGSLGFVYNLTKKWSISLNLATGFRSPNVDDLGKVFDSEPGSVVVPNPNLSAEYSYNTELGIARVFGDFLKADVTGFYTILENALVRRDFTLNGQDSILYDGELSQVQAMQNAAQATVYGVQAGLEVKLPAGFGISSHFTYQEGEEELDDGSVSPLRHAAPWFGISHLTYSANKLTLDFYGMYSGEVSYENMAEEERGKDYMYAIDDNGNPYSPSWLTLNFKAMYQLTDNFGVSAGLENITDLRYRPYSSGIVAPGRNFILSFRAAF